MTEMLLCLLLLSAFTLLSLSFYHPLNVDHYYFLNDYMLKQSESIRDNTYVYFEQGITFNSMGHVNLARTIRFDRKNITINLGSGYALVR